MTTPTVRRSSSSRSARAAEPDLPELTGRLHLAVARLVRRLRREAPTTLSQSAVSALATLVVEGPMRAGDLAVREGVRPPTMTRILAVLEEGGHIVRGPDPADGRAWLMRPTAAGSALVAGARTARADRLAAHLARLTPQQRAAIVAALPALEALAAIEESTVDTSDPPGRH